MSDDYKKRLTGILEGTELSEDQKAKLEEIFPELKESEDERISKILIRVIKELAKGYDRIAADLSLQDAVAWLRKKEKKNTTFKYVYPKFRIGDVIEPVKPNRSPFIPVRIRSILDGSYICYSDDNCHYINYPIQSVDAEFKLTDQYVEELAGDDERIRKEIIETINLAYDCGCSLNKDQCDRYLAWLEKRQTEIITVCPRFRAGDTVRPKDGNDCHTITSITSDRFYKDDTGWCLDILAQDNYELVKPGQDAWSEVDEKNLEETIWYVENGGKLVFEKTDKLVSWLKSIKPQSHWRPSDEQMEALWNSIPENVMEFSEREQLLDNLYQDLKKLL